MQLQYACGICLWLPNILLVILFVEAICITLATLSENTLLVKASCIAYYHLAFSGIDMYLFN